MICNTEEQLKNAIGSETFDMVKREIQLQYSDGEYNKLTTFLKASVVQSDKEQTATILYGIRDDNNVLFIETCRSLSDIDGFIDEFDEITENEAVKLIEYNEAKS